MQTYHCNHCGIECATIFDVFLHIFTDHLHVDIGLDPVESKRLLPCTEGKPLRIILKPN
jgi:hypothetical protein